MSQEFIKCTFDFDQYPKELLEQKLSETLKEIFENYTNYDYREKLVLKALSLAKDLNYKSGFRHDSKDPEWPVVVIFLPNEIGEISFHMPPSGILYDNSTQKTQEERTKIYASLIENNKKKTNNKNPNLNPKKKK